MFLSRFSSSFLLLLVSTTAWPATAPPPLAKRERLRFEITFGVSALIDSFIRRHSYYKSYITGGGGGISLSRYPLRAGGVPTDPIFSGYEVRTGKNGGSFTCVYVVAINNTRNVKKVKRKWNIGWKFSSFSDKFLIIS